MVEPSSTLRIGGSEGGRFRPCRGVPLLLLVLAAACATPTEPFSPSFSEAGVHSWSREVTDLMDAHRVRLGCEPLLWHEGGAGVATAYARQMSEERFFGHVDPAGTTLKQRLDRAGISGYRLAAEVIAAGQTSPQKALEAWLASPAHKEIVEDCQFSRVGAGFHEGSGPYRTYWTAVFFSVR